MKANEDTQPLTEASFRRNHLGGPLVARRGAAPGGACGAAAWSARGGKRRRKKGQNDFIDTPGAV
jgi:hypothetical protein